MPMRCLIVDDNGSFISAARTFLEQDGLSIVGVARTTADALRCAKTLRPDVILVDIFLGDESGLGLAARLHEPNGGPAVILISTHAEADVSELVAESGADGFLPKAELSADAVRSLVEKRPR